MKNKEKEYWLRFIENIIFQYLKFFRNLKNVKT